MGRPPQVRWLEGELGLAEGKIHEAAASFKGAAKRLQTLAENSSFKA